MTYNLRSAKGSVKSAHPFAKLQILRRAYTPTQVSLRVQCKGDISMTEMNGSVLFRPSPRYTCARQCF